MIAINERQLDFKLEIEVNSNKNNIFSIIFYANTYSFLEIKSIKKNDLLENSFYNKFSPDKIKENKYFIQFDDLNEICNELSDRIKMKEIKLIENNDNLIIIISLPSSKIKEIAFQLNKNIKNEQEQINDLTKIIVELKNEIKDNKNEHKNEINEHKNEINELKNEINKHKNEIKELKNEHKNEIKELKNEYKNEIKELKLKYVELIDENNKNNNLIKNNLMKEIEKLNLSNNQKENEIIILNQKIENMKKMITLSYTTLIDFSKKLKKYASKEFQNNTVNLFLKGFKEFIEKLNNGNFNENSDELQGLETICNFINLIPLEIEILYKRILSLKYINNNNNTNYKNVQNLNKNNLSLNTLSDISQNKKLSKYKTSDNNLFFKNKEIKINELNINELTNSGNDSTKKYIKKSKDKNKDLESDK